MMVQKEGKEEEGRKEKIGSEMLNVRIRVPHMLNVLDVFCTD